MAAYDGENRTTIEGNLLKNGLELKPMYVLQRILV